MTARNLQFAIFGYLTREGIYPDKHWEKVANMLGISWFQSEYQWKITKPFEDTEGERHKLELRIIGLCRQLNKYQKTK